MGCCHRVGGTKCMRLIFYTVCKYIISFFYYNSPRLSDSVLQHQGLVWKIVTTAFVSVWPSTHPLASMRNFVIAFKVSTSNKAWAWLISFCFLLRGEKSRFRSMDSPLKQLSCSHVPSFPGNQLTLGIHEGYILITQAEMWSYFIKLCWYSLSFTNCFSAFCVISTERL